MILFNVCTKDEDTFKIDNNTKNFVVAIFGFFPYQMQEEVDSFLEKELQTEKTLKYEDCLDFTTNINSMYKSLIGYNCVGGGTYDEAYLITKSFDSEIEAREFIEKKIKSSDYVTKRMFTDIEVLDADKVNSYLKKEVEYSNVKKEKENLLDQEMAQFILHLKDKYKDDKEFLNVLNSYKK